jgi:histidinol dehydrogenase
MKPQRLNWSALGPAERRLALSRPAADRINVRQLVTEIIQQVREDGDAALMALSEQFDGRRPTQIRIDSVEMTEASSRCSEPVFDAIRNAERRIRKFHRAGLPLGVDLVTALGVRCEARYQAIDPVGLYVPGGSAVLVSTALMLGVPAHLAGCENIVLCTPPGTDGGVAPEILAAAALCGIDIVCAVGGAQAIAAMAYGTQSVPRCSKLFGPGNAWVTEAKQQVSMDPDGAAIDLPAGPSEVVVIADDSADATAIAWDLLSQAEHGPDSQVILLTDQASVADAVAVCLQELAASLPRAEVLKTSLSAARLIVTRDINEAVAISNDYAPEHLIVNTREARRVADSARNVGSIFIGPWTPESLGDYCSGTNHVLPTGGWARSHGALGVADFMRRFTLQEATEEGLRQLGPTAETLAAFEGLEAHRMAVRYRLDAPEAQ